MRRLIALLIVVLLFTGCAFSGRHVNEPVTFYYLRTHSDSNTYDDFFSEGIIGSEEREAAGHRENLNYLLTVYFKGPLSTELASPFPAGTGILEIRHDNNQMTLLLNPILAEKSDLEITVACACLAKTCIDLEDVDTVCIESQDFEGKLLFSRVFTKDNLFLNDDYTQPEDSAADSQ